MAPTKSVTDLPKKVVKKRVTKAKPVKPPLKTPTCITLKITNLGAKPPKIARKVTSQRKIELANEVALEQLTKPPDSSPSTKVLTNTESGVTPEVAKIKPTPKRKPKSTPNDTADNTLQTKKSTKPSEEAVKPKEKRILTLKTSKCDTPLKSPAKRKQNNATVDESESETSTISKKPGPKSRTMNRPKKIAKPETVQETIDTKNNVRPALARTNNWPGKTRQQKVIPDFFSDGPPDGGTIKPEEIPKTPVKRVYKRKRISKKQETESTKNESEETAAKKPRGRTRAKFISERLNGTKLKVTRVTKGKDTNGKSIKVAATMLEQALKNEAAQVQTRSNSVNSTNSNLSWTRDISTASSVTSGTTTCVTVSSSDFVRFDKKLPIVQVEHTNLDRLKVTEPVIEDKLLENDSSSSDSDSESSESSTGTDLDEPVSKSELNLSTSSLTAKSLQSESMPNKTDSLWLELDKLSNIMKNFYAEVSKWTVCDEDDTATYSTLLGAMNLERDVMNHCENFSSILDSMKSFTKNFNPKLHDTCQSTNVDSVNTRLALDIPSTSRLDLEANKIDSYGCPIKTRDKFPGPPHSPVKSNGSSETFTSDNYNYISFDDKVCDDEDALSLYAESITGIESSRLSSISNISVQEPYVPKPLPRSHEAYIPKPTRSGLLERYTYRPTRIGDQLPKRMDDVPLKIIEPKMVEKKNADSSSISKETDLNKKALDLLKDANRLSSLAEGSVKVSEIQPANKPRRLFSHYQPVNAVKSALYRGHCFFYLSSQCKNMNCRFPHEYIDINIAKCRLTALSEDSLIEEYLLTVKFNNLRRKYGLLFIQECQRRESTRILMEIAIDLGLGVVEWEDNGLIVSALETTLLHLNTVSFEECAVLLTFQHKGNMMCDALLLCMAHSQNFAQFKRAFVKLVNFMAQIKRPVDIGTVGNILERVCILPCEDSLARGMLCLMKNTHGRIFENTMTKSFEVQLSNIDSDVHDEYLIAKKAALEALQADLSPRVSREGPRNPSPDTTNLDSLKIAQIVQPTTFKRTIDTEAIRHLFKSPSQPAPKQRYTIPRGAHWRGVGYTLRPPMRGRQQLNRVPSGRRVYRTTNQRNGTNS